jgi:hypothetical protein
MRNEKKGKKGKLFGTFNQVAFTFEAPYSNLSYSFNTKRKFSDKGQSGDSKRSWEHAEILGEPPGAHYQAPRECPHPFGLTFLPEIKTLESFKYSVTLLQFVFLGGGVGGLCVVANNFYQLFYTQNIVDQERDTFNT